MILLERFVPFFKKNNIPMEPKTGKLKTEKPWAEALKAMANP